MNSHMLFLLLLGVVLGFFWKYAWDLFRNKNLGESQRAQQGRIETLERQLCEFYWPILVHLRRNHIVWKRLLHSREAPLETDKNLRLVLPRDYFFPNNEKILRIIQRKYCLAQAPENVRIQVDLFIRHQAVLQALRQTLDLDVDPIEFGEPWPNRFLPAMEEHTALLQKEYDELIVRYGGQRDGRSGLPPSVPEENEQV